MKKYLGKYIKIISYNPSTDKYYRIVYGFVKDSILTLNSLNDTLFVGNFYAKEIDDNGKFKEGGKIDNICYVSNHKDCHREVEKDEFEQFKNDFINEMISYEQNSIKK